VQYVGHRADLGYLVAMVGGELTVGHSYLSGAGDLPDDDNISVGLLGADFAIENGRYRIKKILGGENWNPELQAPLSAPGIQVAEGDYLLEVNGRPLAPPTNLYSLFQGTAGRQTVIRVSSTTAIEGSRLLTVTPIANESGLRTRAWIEDNRRLVDKLSGGRLAYVWLPNTAAAGYTYFNRYFFAQQDKEGAVIDERYNGGGQIADYIVNELERKLDGYFVRRDGKPKTSPASGLFGPKVLVINESAGSGGDALPYMFKLRKIGPLVGTRTWGALVGTLQIPATMDGGGITAPSLAFYDLHGRWAVENEGVAPDIEVEYTPAEVNAGHDPQLERAVKEALALLEKGTVRHTRRPNPVFLLAGRLTVKYVPPPAAISPVPRGHACSFARLHGESRAAATARHLSRLHPATHRAGRRRHPPTAGDHRRVRRLRGHSDRDLGCRLRRARAAGTAPSRGQSRRARHRSILVRRRASGLCLRACRREGR
jgi:tricorn protease